jgi:cyclase
MRIAIINYNGGNIASVANALERFGLDYTVTRDPKVILAADKVIFPGQGRAAPAMKDLRNSGLDEVIKKITSPFLGVCLGMQLLFPSSEEDDTECLGIIGGKVQKFREANLKVPQIGWNTVTQSQPDPLFEEIPDTMYAYFVNSYYVSAEKRYVLGQSTYGNTSCATIVRKGNFYGTQFHPEKSGPGGLQLLKNFCGLGESEKRKTLIIPAIDLIDGKCVRLYQGDYQQKTIYSNDPITVAQSFVEQGARYVHIVDLDGAKQGQPVNQALITELVKEVAVPVQVGGGLRNIDQARSYLDSGVQRIIISTSVLSNPVMIRQLIAEYGPGRIVVSVDAKDGQVAIKGWQEVTNKTILSFLDDLADLGVTTIIYTDITSDGTLKGPDYERLGSVLARPFRVMIAGGIAKPEDIRRLNQMGAYGVITGKALYEKTLDLEGITQSMPQPQVAGSLIKPTKTVTKRVIACMDIANGRVVKGTNFKKLRDAGDPVELGKLYSDSGIDELVFLDIKATVENRPTLYKLVSRIAKNINIPFTVGGGVKTVQDIKELLNAGADKVSIGSAAVTDPDFVDQAAKEFGSQCIVISVDPKRNKDSWEIYINGGRDATGIDAIEFSCDIEERGAGELLVNSLDKDGTKEGYDLKLLQAVGNAVSLPVIASSGAGSMEDFVQALTIGHADAALAASLFHNREIKIVDLKEYLNSKGILIRI